MPRDPLTLPLGPFEHEAMDYGLLRRRGIEHLQRLTGDAGTWTDFNTHDPGITILEQLCFAITDLSYRIAYPLPDLLAKVGEDGYRSLYGPARILTSRPVTLTDLRKLVLDVEGVKNAWVEPAEAGQPDTPTPTLYYQTYRDPENADQTATEHQFWLSTDGSAEVVAPNGLYRVVVEKSGTLPDMVVQDGVARRLHAVRNVCEDLETISVLPVENVPIQAHIEIHPVVDPHDVLAEIYRRIDQYLSPRVHFSTLQQMLDRGQRMDQIFDGPLLDQGFIADSDLETLEHRTAIHTSDLIRELMDIEAVRAVRHISIGLGETTQTWVYELTPNHAPRLDRDGSKIELTRDQLAFQLDPKRVPGPGQTAQTRRGDRRDLVPPPGPDRNIAKYRSIQHQFPAAYGIGFMGLGDSASPERRARAKQLKAYLLFFDQLLANFFAQVAEAWRLFSFFDLGNGDFDALQSYFFQVLDDPTLGLEGIRAGSLEEHSLALAGIVEPGGPSGSARRRNRFLDHLLARFGEDFTDYSLLALGAQPEPNGPPPSSVHSRYRELARDKQVFLQEYPRIGQDRATGHDILAVSGAGKVSGLKQRISLALGLDPAPKEPGEEPFLLIEHILLRPVPQDLSAAPGDDENAPAVTRQPSPILAKTLYRDPYSLQISFVFRESLLTEKNRAGFRALIEQTIRRETPAHIMPYIAWLDGDPDGNGQGDGQGDGNGQRLAWQDFVGLYQTWRQAQWAYRDWITRHRADPNAIMPGTIHLPARDARDQLIDHLFIRPLSRADERPFGETYPLRDVPVASEDEDKRVPYGETTRIAIQAPQLGVQYQLCNEDGVALEWFNETGEALGGPVATDPGSSLVSLTTPPIIDRVTFTISAQKIAHPERKVYLRQSVTLRVGIDAVLDDVTILVPAEGEDNPHQIGYFRSDQQSPTGPRIADYNAQVEVGLWPTQPSVSYQLVDSERFHLNDPSEHTLSTQVTATGKATKLQSDAIGEDLEIAIYVEKIFPPELGIEPERTLLRVAEETDEILTLPLAVRARLDIDILPPTDVAYRGDAATNAAIALLDTQDSVSYRLRARPIYDHEFRYGSQAGEALGIRLQQGHDVHLASGATAELETIPSSTQSSDDRLSLAFALDRHSAVDIWAHKTYLGEAYADKLTDQHPPWNVIPILVRPNPEPELRLRVWMTETGAATSGTLEVQGGQPGVYYQFSRGPDTNNDWTPAYFHKMLDRDPTVNKGLDDLRIGELLDGDPGIEPGGDFSIARDALDADAEPTTRPPPPPLIDTGELAAGVVLSVRAIDAQTGLGADPQNPILPKTATIATLPRMSATRHDDGSGTVTITDSLAAQSYQLIQNDTRIGDPRLGNGDTLTYALLTLSLNDALEMIVTPATDGIPVEHLVGIPISQQTPGP